MKKRLKINGVIISFAVLVVIIFPRFFFKGCVEGFWERFVEVAGFALILLGQIIRVSARGYKSEHSRESQALIQGGPYQVVRNPMYLGILLIGLGVVLTMFKWWAVAIFLLVFIARYLLLIYEEEKKLNQIFPGAYPVYCQAVPRLFPSVLKLFKLDISDYLPIKLSWFYREIGSIITMLLFILLVESWSDIIQEGFTGFLKHFVWLFLIFILFTLLVMLISKRTKERNENKTT